MAERTLPLADVRTQDIFAGLPNSPVSGNARARPHSPPRCDAVKNPLAASPYSKAESSVCRPLTLQPNPTEPQRIRHNRNRTEAHRSRGDHRTQQQDEEGVEHAGRNGDTERVVDEREEEVPPDRLRRLSFWGMA